jgi:hypothetical protein
LGIRALLDFRPPYGLRDLSERAGVSVGTLYRVLQFAEGDVGDVLIEREPRGPVTSVNWEQLIRRWAIDYSLTRSNETSLYLEPRGVEAFVRRLREYRGEYALTGSLAAQTVVREAPAVLAATYVTSLEVASELGLRPAESGGNVMLVQPFPSRSQPRPEANAPFVRTREVDGLRYVAMSQAAVDLLTSPGRGPAEAEALIEWMKGNEDAWRTS